MKKVKKTIGWKPSFIGILFAVIFLLLSVLPSLLPRPALIQGIISGISMAVGYGLGVATSSLFRWFAQKEVSKKHKKIAWSVLKIATPIVAIIALFLGLIWQNQVRDLLGVELISVGYSLITIIVAAITFILLISVSRLIRKTGNKINNLLKKKVPIRLAVALAISASFFLVYFIVSGVLASTFYKVVDGIYGARDGTVPEGIVQPKSELRSGSPNAIISWDKVGYQGRVFVGGGPTKKQIQEFNNVPAEEPIRVYAGLASADTAQKRAELAIEELKRTNAFDRDILVIATATGTGWLDPKVVDALEFVHNGDTAIVTQQYSYLPSWISFLVDQARAREAGMVLYDAVMEEILKLPEDERPKILSYGLSLGSFGGQEAFSGVNDIRRSVDGALFTGTPGATRLWRNITDSRDEGSPEWQPIYDGGKSVRFASTKDDILSNPETWDDKTRILFLQHANDPVVWFDFSLIFNKPDWLNEPRGGPVSPNTRWYPIVTFLHVGLDQAVAASAPPENGHYYVNTPAYAWGAVLPPDGWSDEKAEKLQEFLDNDFKSARIKE